MAERAGATESSHTTEEYTPSSYEEKSGPETGLSEPKVVPTETKKGTSEDATGQRTASPRKYLSAIPIVLEALKCLGEGALEVFFSFLSNVKSTSLFHV